ncbi:MAG: hypothetical protein ABSG38_15520 [Spirochaetia bacterium]|jgi:hypothetical protein
MKKKTVTAMFNEPNDPMPVKKEPKKQEYDVDELCEMPPGYHRRMAFYEHLRKEEEKKNEKG